MDVPSTELVVDADATDAAVAAPKRRATRRPFVLDWKLTVRGGVNAQPKVVDTISAVACGDQKFARLSKKEAWFVQSIVAGGGVKRNAVCRVRVIDLIKTELDRLLKAKLDGQQSSDVADDSQEAVAPAAVPDIMDALDAIDDQASPPPKKKKYEHKRERAQSIAVSMTEQPLCVDVNSPRKVITVLNLSTTSIWINTNDISWLLAYAMDELECGGVPAVEDEDEDEEPDQTASNGDVPNPKPKCAGSNCGFPGLRIEWDHKDNTETYTASFSSGPCQGTEVIGKLASFTADKWATLQPPRNGSFEAASYAERRDGLFDYVMQRCIMLFQIETGAVK